MKLGIDIGGTTTTVAVVDDGYRIVSKNCMATQGERDSAAVVKDIADLAFKTVKDANLSMDDVSSVGIGSPGIVDKSTKSVLYSNNIKWKNVNLCDDISKHIANKRMYIDNDANCAILGEWVAGAARGYSSAVMVTIGTGIGGGIILNGKIHNGFNSAANVIGHMSIVSGGRMCTCGRRGCWEAYASATALIRTADQVARVNPRSELSYVKARDGELNGKNIFETARNGDREATDIVNGFMFFIAEGITNIINILQPEIVVLGGGVSNEGEYLLDNITRQVRSDVFCKDIELPKIKIAKLKNDAGIIGAASLGVFDKSP